MRGHGRHADDALDVIALAAFDELVRDGEREATAGGATGHEEFVMVGPELFGMVPGLDGVSIA